MVSSFYLRMLKKHTPLFYGLDAVKSPFLVSVSPLIPNKLKYVKEPVQEFDSIDHGMYFLVPGKNELTVRQLETLENNVLDHMRQGLKPSFSLKRCKSFANKFRASKQSPFFNTFSMRESRLYLNPLKVIVDKKPMSFNDFQLFLTHLINFYVMCSKMDYDSPFLTKTIDKNLTMIKESLSGKTSLVILYNVNRFSKAPTLTIKSDSFDYMFDGSDIESLLEFLMPLLYSVFTDDTQLSNFMNYQ